MAFPRYLVTLTVATSLLLSAGVARAAPDWKVIKVGIWDYVTVDNFAQFYGLPTGVAPVNKTIRLDNGTNSVEVKLESRQAFINGVRNSLCWPIIEKDGHYLIHRIDLAKTFEPELRPHLIRNLGRVQTVVLDPGHGGHDKGATNLYGCEKDFALDTARQLKPLLEAKGFKVVMTRNSDVFVPLEERARIANQTRDCIFVSIHFNATDTNPHAAGFEIYSLTPRGAPSSQDDSLALHFPNMQAGSPVDAPSLALSTSIYHSVVAHLPEFDRGIKRARFAVLRLTRVPAVLVEGGFVTERNESRLIANGIWRAKLAQSISGGIENYRGLVDKKRRPMLVADYRRQLNGGELIARDATQPPPGNQADPSLVMPTSNVVNGQAPPAPEIEHHLAATESGAENSPGDQTVPTPAEVPPIAEQVNPSAGFSAGLVPEHLSLAASEPAPPVELPAAAVENRNAALPVSEAKTARGVWWLGPFPKFQP
ncbi:MAG TPA: N-acetylmuramoyl-L-alanine amidase [Chthoniobacterales bacterium]|nr:N-acetylmuramoyl-L-alanine amidase [Chthoniobacterales bacterium]